MISCSPSTMKTADSCAECFDQCDGTLYQCGKGYAQHDDQRWEQSAGSHGL